MGQDHDGYPWESWAAINAWLGTAAGEETPLLVLAPRHPEKFGQVEGMASAYRYVRASRWMDAEATGSDRSQAERLQIVVLDTIGDLAAVYAVADIAFVGGSLVLRGGHSPLEPAQFGVPVVMGPSYENFRDVVGKMRAANAICIVKDVDELEGVLLGMLKDRDAARAMGERGRQVFEAQQGATGRAVEAIVRMVKQ
jgi:3-deoxy-D-manno-octulosonic-acid transferase